jgi:hypothetical protein
MRLAVVGLVPGPGSGAYGERTDGWSSVSELTLVDEPGAPELSGRQEPASATLGSVSTRTTRER